METFRAVVLEINPATMKPEEKHIFEGELPRGFAVLKIEEKLYHVQNVIWDTTQDCAFFYVIDPIRFERAKEIMGAKGGIKYQGKGEKSFTQKIKSPKNIN